MLDNLRMWFYRNQKEIVWFIIGFLVSSGFTDLATRNYGGAAVSFGLAFLNYVLNKR